jgi:hypothetical protein
VTITVLVAAARTVKATKTRKKMEEMRENIFDLSGGCSGGWLISHIVVTVYIEENNLGILKRNICVY